MTMSASHRSWSSCMAPGTTRMASWILAGRWLQVAEVHSFSRFAGPDREARLGIVGSRAHPLRQRPTPKPASPRPPTASCICSRMRLLFLTVTRRGYTCLATAKEPLSPGRFLRLSGRGPICCVGLRAIPDDYFRGSRNRAPTSANAWRPPRRWPSGTCSARTGSKI
jgi:hypothetical protein